MRSTDNSWLFDINDEFSEVWHCPTNRCFYCGQKEGPANRLTIDHLKPQSNGGSNHCSNLRRACMSCNLQKGSMSVREFVLFQLGKCLDAIEITVARQARDRNSVIQRFVDLMRIDSQAAFALLHSTPRIAYSDREIQSVSGHIALWHWLVRFQFNDFEGYGGHYTRIPVPESFTADAFHYDLVESTWGRIRIKEREDLNVLWSGVGEDRQLHVDLWHDIQVAWDNRRGAQKHHSIFFREKTPEESLSFCKQWAMFCERLYLELQTETAKAQYIHALSKLKNAESLAVGSINQ